MEAARCIYVQRERTLSNTRYQLPLENSKMSPF